MNILENKKFQKGLHTIKKYYLHKNKEEKKQEEKEKAIVKGITEIQSLGEEKEIKAAFIVDGEEKFSYLFDIEVIRSKKGKESFRAVHIGGRYDLNREALVLEQNMQLIMKGKAKNSKKVKLYKLDV